MFGRYRGFVGAGPIEELNKLASGLRGISVLNISSSRLGGGVAEILKRFLPLLEEGGMDARWEVINGSEDFLPVTKDIHRGLQGTDVSISDEQWSLYENEVTTWAGGVNMDADIIVVHDPQPLPLVLRRNGTTKWVWRCHIDLSAPNRGTWGQLKKYISLYDATIFSLSSFAPGLWPREFVIAPSIDPLSAKNIDLPETAIDEVRAKYGVGETPLITQVSRFDHFKDPIGVVEAYARVKERINCQLALVSGPAEDDPEQAAVASEVARVIGDDPDAKIIFLPPNSDKEINAIQRMSEIVIQKSVKEGFGLPVAEAMWKKRPVIGGRVGGIELQIKDSVNGYLVSSVGEAAEKIEYLLLNPEAGVRLGAAARESVRTNFLITRELRDHYLMFAELI
jgi:trehalose synthase